MPRKSQRVAYPLTFLLKKEGELWASLTPEMGVASCGDNVDHAREMLKDAITGRLRYLLEAGHADQIWHPMTRAGVEDFATDPPGEVTTERYVMVVTVPAEEAGRRRRPRVEFIPSPTPTGIRTESFAAI